MNVLTVFSKCNSLCWLITNTSYKLYNKLLEKFYFRSATKLFS